MYFFLIEDKNVYLDNKLVRFANTHDLSHTWEPNKDLKEHDINYAYIFCEGKNLNEVCPENLKNKWDYLRKLHNSYKNAFVTAKIDLNLIHFYELLPESFVNEYFTTKIQILEHVFKTYDKPKNYEYLLELQFMLEDIKTKKINVDFEYINKDLLCTNDKTILSLCNKLKSCLFIKYKNFSSITGRLTTDKNSFPILTLNKKHRKYIKPNNHLFLELDYNGAEIRTLLALNKQQQPSIDIHDWHRALYSKYGFNFSRDETKKYFFEWFYGQKDSSGIKEIDSFYDREFTLKTYWDGIKINNPYGRIIVSDEYHALSYLIQSTAWDIFSRKAIEIHNYLNQNKSQSAITILLHDSLIIDLCKIDLPKIHDLVEIFSTTDFGKFKVNVKIGKDLGNMEIYE